MTKALLLPFLAALFLVGACGDKKSSGSGSKSSKVASCKTEMSCTEYVDKDLATGEDSIRELCENPAIGGKFTPTACPTDKLVGKCSKLLGTDFYYEATGMKTADVQQMCGDKFIKP